MKKLYFATVLVLVWCSVAVAFSFGFNFGFGGKPGARYIDLEPSLSWSTNAYEFGEVNVGETATTEFTLSNTGNDIAEDVTVSTASPYRIYSTVIQGNISSGGSRVVKVEYKPTSAGVHAVQLRYSAPNISPVAVELSGSGVSAEPTYLFTETFDSAGTTASSGGSWNTTGSSGANRSINWDNTTAPPQGTEYLSLTVTAAGSYNIVNSPTIAGLPDDVYLALRFRQNARPAGNNNLITLNSAGTPVATMRVTTTGVAALAPGQSTGATTATSLDTWLYLQVKYTKGAGANSRADIWVSTDGAIWTSGAASINGTATGVVDGMTLISNTGQAAVFDFDDVRMSDSMINW